MTLGTPPRAGSGGGRVAGEGGKGQAAPVVGGGAGEGPPAGLPRRQARTASVAFLDAPRRLRRGNLVGVTGVPCKTRKGELSITFQAPMRAVGRVLRRPSLRLLSPLLPPPCPAVILPPPLTQPLPPPPTRPPLTPLPAWPPLSSDTPSARRWDSWYHWRGGSSSLVPGVKTFAFLADAHSPFASTGVSTTTTGRWGCFGGQSRRSVSRSTRSLRVAAGVPGADGDGGDDLTETGAAGPDGHMEQDPYEKLVETNQKIADKEDELRRVRSLKRDQRAALSLAGRSDKELDILMFQAKELSADIQETKEELAELKSARDNLTQLLMATRPMQMLLRESRRFLKQSKERSLTLTLETKPPYDPAGSGTPINRDLLVASAWHYFVVGDALAAPDQLDQDTSDAVKQTRRTADAGGPEDASEPDVRHVGLIGGSSGMGKTHFGLDVWHYRDKLDQPRFAKAAADAGVRKADWADVCSVAQGMRVCCINFNGGSPWSPDDVSLVKLSPWYKATHPDDGVKQVPGAQEVPDAHLLPLYLRVLWGLMHQADMSYASFSRMALTRLRLGHVTAEGIIAEAEEALLAHRHAVIVDELTLATMHAGDRQLSELYRHVICTFTGLQASVLFLSLSFLFVRAEIDAGSSEVFVPHGGIPPGTAALRTTGEGGDGSPWNLVVVGQLTRKSYAEVKKNLLPVASKRTVYSPRSVGGSNYAAAADVADAFAHLSGGHMRSYAYLRRKLNRCPAKVTLWRVVEDAFLATGVTKSARQLLRHSVFFPGLLVAGLLPCTVRGRASMPMVGAGAPVGFSMTFDDAISRNLLYGSPDKKGVYKNPSLPPSMIVGLSTEWEDALSELKNSGYQVSPVVRNFLCACSRMLSAADVADPGRGWELACFWAEVMMSHVRHGAELFLMGTPGVSGVQDFSRVSLKDLYKGVDNLERKPVHHPLLSDVLVDATRPLTLEDEIPELITRYRDVNDVLKLPPDLLLSRAFMMVNAHLSFDVIRFLPVVDDPRPHAESSKRTNGMIAVCISCKSTTDTALSVPLELVKKGEKLLPKVFGDESWDSWQYNVVHVTICNHRRTSSPSVFLDDVRAAERIVVVCRDNFKSIYGVGLSGIMSSAPMLHGTKVVR